MSCGDGLWQQDGGMVVLGRGGAGVGRQGFVRTRRCWCWAAEDIDVVMLSAGDENSFLRTDGEGHFDHVGQRLISHRRHHVWNVCCGEKWCMFFCETSRTA